MATRKAIASYFPSAASGIFDVAANVARFKSLVVGSTLEAELDAAIEYVYSKINPSSAGLTTGTRTADEIKASLANDATLFLSGSLSSLDLFHNATQSSDASRMNWLI